MWGPESSETLRRVFMNRSIGQQDNPRKFRNVILFVRYLPSAIALPRMRLQFLGALGLLLLEPGLAVKYYPTVEVP